MDKMKEKENAWRLSESRISLTPSSTLEWVTPQE
jgi:hypothetical protein